MRLMIARPSQYALKFPATNPDRMLSDAPPSREAVTTSRTWADDVEVNTLTSSGMMAPASVPQVITVDSCHQRSVFPLRFGMSSFERTYVSTTETIEVTQTSTVSGVSKFMRASSRYLPVLTALVPRYEKPEASTIITRIMKIQTRSCTWMDGSWTASMMNEMSATPVTPYVSKPSAVGPTESPALSPVQSAMTPGFRASSSLILNTTFIRSEPMSAILVKMPPAILSAAAPNDSPIAKPRKQAPATSEGMKSRMASMNSSSTEMSIMPTLMPERSGISDTGHAFPRSAANAVRELAKVLIRIPNQATP